MKTDTLIDTHAHLDMFPPAEVDEIIDRAQAAGVGRIITIGTDVKTSRISTELAASKRRVFAGVGVHPHDAREFNAEGEKEIRGLCRAPKVVAVGETGLDYYRMRAPKEDQIEAFKRHIDIARDLGLPLIVHCRDAYEDLMTILEKERPPRVLLHCFSGNIDQSAVFLDMGCHVSFAGPVTFSKAEGIREVVASVPLDRIHLETDAPFLAPVPYRGRQNEPAYIKSTAEKVALIKGLPLDELVKHPSANADKFFGPQLEE